MTLKIRDAHQGDADILTDIMHQAKASRGHDATDPGSLRSALRVNPSSLGRQDVLVAERNGKPVGFARGTFKSEAADTLYVIDDLYVAPAAAGNGIGRLLMSRLTDQARQLGATCLRLESDDVTCGFYETLGFDIIGSRASLTAPDNGLTAMEKQIGSGIERLTGIDIRLERGKAWAFEDEHKAEIDAYWQYLLTANPQLWNGRTLKLTGHAFENGVLTGHCRECSYAAFLAWRDWGAPDISTFNLFGSAVVRSSDGAILYGVMAAHTAMPGKIYPAGGNLDPGDILEDGTIDVVGSIYRELEEETGLKAADHAEANLYAIFDGPRISIARVIDIDRPANTLRRDMVAHSMASEEKELSDIHVIRSAEDLKNPNIMPYAKRFAGHLLNL